MVSLYSSGWNETYYVSQEILELRDQNASLSYIPVKYHHAQPVSLHYFVYCYYCMIENTCVPLEVKTVCIGGFLPCTVDLHSKYFYQSPRHLASS